MSKNIELADKMKSQICKIRCISYFIETQNQEHQRPLEFEEIQFGLYLILNEILTELTKIKESLDQE